MVKKLKFKCEKLIRGKIPQIMLEKYNSSTKTRIMDDAEYKLALNKKLLEECQEVIDAKTVLEVKEELADVLEVIKTIAKFHKLSLGDIESSRDLKVQKNGDFEQKIYLEYIEMDSDNPKADYYLSNPDKYPILS